MHAILGFPFEAALSQAAACIAFGGRFGEGGGKPQCSTPHICSCFFPSPVAGSKYSWGGSDPKISHLLYCSPTPFFVKTHFGLCENPFQGWTELISNEHEVIRDFPQKVQIFQLHSRAGKCWTPQLYFVKTRECKMNMSWTPLDFIFIKK